MELVVKATCAETIKFSLPHECHIFAVIKILTRPAALLPTVGQNPHLSRTFLIWSSRPQSSHIESTMGPAANKRGGGRRHSCLPTLSQSWDDTWQNIRWPASLMSSHSESTMSAASTSGDVNTVHNCTLRRRPPPSLSLQPFARRRWRVVSLVSMPNHMW